MTKSRASIVKIDREYNYEDFRMRVENICEQNAAREAFLYMQSDGVNASLSFEDVLKIIKNLSAEMKHSGIMKGDRVAIISPMMPSAVISGIALAYSNVTAVLIDPTLPKEEINRLLTESDVRGAFTTERIFEMLNKDIVSQIPVYSVEAGMTGSQRFLLSAEKVLLKETVDRHEDVAVILFSSGTTASMKGIMLTYHSVMRSRDLFADISGMNINTSYLVVFPYNHISGYSSTMMYFLTGCPMGMIENVNASKLAEGLQAYNPYHFGMVPKVYDIMADKIRAAIHEKGVAVETVINAMISFSGLVRRKTGVRLGKYLLGIVYKQALGKNICGLAILGTPCTKETAELFLNMGIEWANLYATTETNAPVCCTGIHDRYPENSVGNIHRYEDDIKIKINNPDSNGVGEVYVKSGLIMKGYFRDDKLTAEAYDNGYFKTGDLGYLDKDDNLYICGRSKDTIMLHNGKKVSATDVDAFYQQICGAISVACCAVMTKDGYDELHLFIEQGASNKAELEACRDKVREKAADSAYKLAGIHFVEKIPVTSVGKVKRYLLKQQIDTAENKTIEHSEITTAADATLDEVIIAMLARYSGQNADSIHEQSDLKKDLGIDSLTMFEIVSEIAEKLSVDIAGALEGVNTVGDLIKAVREPHTIGTGMDISKYPLPQTEASLKQLNKWIKFFKRTYKFEVKGLENIPKSGNYIISSNHVNNLDPIWLAAAMEGHMDYKNIACLAAVHLFDNKATKKMCDMMGAIPVDRTGNTVPAMNRCKECLDEGMNLIIFPEGHRTSDGKLLPFKNGVAKLATESGKPVLPVKIEGAYDIFPRHKKLPRIFKWFKLSRYTLKISIGKPIYPQGKSVSEITDNLRNTIQSL